MPWKWHVLVIANVTAGSDELLAALKERAASQPTTFHLVIPATSFGGGQAAARETLRDALARLREEGLEADGVVGHSDPATAAIEAWDPRRYDEIIISTLPMRVSKWLRAGLPARVDRLTGALVTHVVSQPPREAPKGEARSGAPEARSGDRRAFRSQLGPAQPQRTGRPASVA